LALKTERRIAKKGSVLIVDDEEIMREVLETLLSSEGYRVDLAKTGEEGLEAYGRRAYDVVLLDVSMRGRSGLAVLKEVRASPDKVPVLVLSAHPKNNTRCARISMTTPQHQRWRRRLSSKQNREQEPFFSREKK